jgi:predicted GIY-YIG superfamily endonuclease
VQRLTRGKVLAARPARTDAKSPSTSQLQPRFKASLIFGTVPSRAWVYVLELQDGRFYVGCSKDLCRRMEEHWLSKAARYTRVYPPVRVYAVHRCEGSGADVLALERRVTLDTMRYCIETHGAGAWERVRGSVWTSIDMPQPPREL